MTASLHALLGNAIDYAGLFPPTKLPLAQALSNYVNYRMHPDQWLLGRFICPAAQLAELLPLLAHLPPPQSHPPLAALGRGGKTAEEFLTGFDADLRAILNTREPNVSAFETRLPEGLMDVAVLSQLIATTTDLFFQNGSTVSSSHFEVSLTGDWRRALQAAVEAVVRVRNSRGNAGIPHLLGLKLRCGGTEPAAFPSVEQVAFALWTCRDAGGVALKFTAGLHHPLRHFDADLRTHMHGFLNVLCAAVLAHVRRLEEHQIVDILTDESAQSFSFTDQELRWKHLRASASEVQISRLTVVGSFGSCSFDEPRSDLRGLGLL